ncbi:TetR/AcrR family transcriptional regulator [Pedobacter xixiisoli]|uniref:Transcriptional regulator, TetR family n=1 Tax=Pedobacter xixiisoli TaxID=1476464 RepID=A0A286AEH5_9SPHI|nr:TetR/AcrR family transcriptional regulator [Pedobacter xixiisoli]SOD20303.1 transcriptional regulator, TetR family [Pedobacter xixiisoli]
MNKEELIKQTAKELFFSKGYLHATTQEIADAAGVNRSLINYYFRSRDLLFQTVYREAVDSLKSQLDKVLYDKIDFQAKISLFIDVYMKELLKYPYRESFLITEICSKNFALKEKKKSAALVHFLKEVGEEMDKGTIKKGDPIQFMFNLFALMSFPVIMKPLYQKLLDISQEKYNTLIAERKQIILDQIFN